MKYACGGPDSPGGTHFTACDCRAEALRREGEARVVAWLRGEPARLEMSPGGCADCIEAGEHLRGESEGGAATMPPLKRFENMVKSGLIDAEGRVLGPDGRPLDGQERDESEGGYLATVAAQSERATREAKMLAKGHGPVSDEEQRLTLDATLHAMEWDPDRNDGGESGGG